MELTVNEIYVSGKGWQEAKEVLKVNEILNKDWEQITINGKDYSRERFIMVFVELEKIKPFMDFLNKIKNHRYICKDDIKEISYDLFKNMRDAEYATGQGNDGWTYKLIKDRVLQLELSSYNRDQKINWDIQDNCKADLRVKKYKEIIKK